MLGAAGLAARDDARGLRQSAPRALTGAPWLWATSCQRPWRCTASEGLRANDRSAAAASILDRRRQCKGLWKGVWLLGEAVLLKKGPPSSSLHFAEVLPYTEVDSPRRGRLDRSPAPALSEAEWGDRREPWGPGANPARAREGRFSAGNGLAHERRDSPPAGLYVWGRPPSHGFLRSPWATARTPLAGLRAAVRKHSADLWARLRARGEGEAPAEPQTRPAPYEEVRPPKADGGWAGASPSHHLIAERALRQAPGPWEGAVGGRRACRRVSQFTGRVYAPFTAAYGQICETGLLGRARPPAGPRRPLSVSEISDSQPYTWQRLAEAEIRWIRR